MFIQRDIRCQSPIHAIFEGDDISIHIDVSVPADFNMMKSIMKLSNGTMIKIKCCLGFDEKKFSLSLIAQIIDEITDVKLVVT